MHTTQYLASALAFVGLVTAQSTTSICNQATATINSQADATALASSCSTVNGAVAIGKSVVNSIVLDGIQQIKGDLIVVGAENMTSLSGKDLNSIGGTMQLSGLKFLSNLGFPVLTSVNAINWAHLTALQGLNFGKPGITRANSVLITDTQLNSLDGIDLTSVSTIDINNNQFLRSYTTQLGNVTGSMNIDSNAPDLKLSFPNLIFAYNMTIRNISSISVPSLRAVNTTLGFYGNYLTQIMCPNLTTIGQSFAIVANSQLSNVSMPALTSVGGGLQIANNTNLLAIDGFPSLKSTGAIDITGNFSSVALPALQDCKGAFNLQSSGNISCSPFDSFRSSKVIKGAYTCASSSNNVQSGAAGQGTSSGSGSSSGTKSAANGLSANVMMVTGASAVVGGLVSLFL